MTEKNGVVETRESEVTGRVVQIKMEDGQVKYKCQFCGKWLIAEESIDMDSGHYCHELREQGLDDVALAELRANRTVEEVPIVTKGTFKGKSWIKTAALHKICTSKSIPVARMVRAMGGDRGIKPPLRDEYNFVYCGKARWVHPWCASDEGLSWLRGLGKESEIPLKEVKAGTTRKRTRTRKSVKPKDTETAAIEEALVTE